MINGILNIYKEPGYTSHDVVAKLRGITGQRKIGHTGTLDPAAEGVLPVCLGNATKICDMLTDQTKTYRAVLLLGVETDTQDTTGTVLARHPVNVTEEEAVSCISSFSGEIQQIPPMYSALKVNGKKLYELARQGIEVERKPRAVTIEEIVAERLELPEAVIRVTCSKGTYIRTLCHDIGKKLGCGGCMKSLVRTRVGDFDVEDSLTLETVAALRDEGKLSQIVAGTDSVFGHFPAIVLDGPKERLVRNGNPIRYRIKSGASGQTGADSKYRIYSESGEFLAVYARDEDSGLLRPVKMFL